MLFFSPRKVLVRVICCEAILHRFSIVVWLGSSRHTQLARCFYQWPEIHALLIGTLLRSYLNEDNACVVEDFLYTRFPFTFETCVFEGDYDGMLYFTKTFRGSCSLCWYPGFMLRCVRYAPDAATLAFLHWCEFSVLSTKDVETCILFCAPARTV